MDEQLLAKLKEIPGWMGDAELEYLYNMVKDGPADALFVEIGAWKGLSTGAMYKAIHGNQVVCTVDSWLGQADLRFTSHGEVTTSDVFLRFLEHMHDLNIKPQWYAPFVTGPTYLRMLSEDAVNLFEGKSIYRLMVDGDHQAVGKDIDLWRYKVRPDGKICGHDWNWTGVMDQVEARLVIQEVIGDLWVAEGAIVSA